MIATHACWYNHLVIAAVATCWWHLGPNLI